MPIVVDDLVQSSCFIERDGSERRLRSAEGLEVGVVVEGLSNSCGLAHSSEA